MTVIIAALFRVFPRCRNKLHQNQNHFCCQVGFHIQGLFSGVFGADLNIEIENTYLQ